MQKAALNTWEPIYWLCGCHECGPEEVGTGSVTTLPDRGSIVQWRRAPGKAIIKLSYSTSTGARLAFSEQRSCWAHIICKTERESLCHVILDFKTLFGPWVTFLITFILQQASISSTIPLSPILSTRYQAWNIIMHFLRGATFLTGCPLNLCPRRPGSGVDRNVKQVDLCLPEGRYRT